MGRLLGKTCVVTGAAHGIAKAVAQVFAAEGASLLLADRDAAAGAAVTDLLCRDGANALFVDTDVSDEGSVQRMIDAGMELGGGKIDGLVNVAGVDIIARLEDHSTARWDRVMDVNLRSVFLTCRAALPALKAARHAAVVNVSSIQAVRGFSGYPGYAATKAGIIGLSQQLAIDYAADGIRVNVVSPGPVVTDLAYTSALHEGEQFPALGPAGAPDIAAETPPEIQLHPPHDRSPRLFKPSECTDIAYPILWLVSDEATAITGTTLTVDGGFTIKGVASLAPGHEPALASQMAQPGFSVTPTPK